MTAITVTVWHNARTGTAGRHPAFFDGYTPGDPMVRVFTYQTQPRGRAPEQIAEDAFAAFNADPEMLCGDQLDLAARYRSRRLRSVSCGDVVVVGEAALAVGRPGVGFRNSATGPDLGFYAARLYSLMRPPSRGWRWIRLRERSATGWPGRGGRRWRLRWGRLPL